MIIEFKTKIIIDTDAVNGKDLRNQLDGFVRQVVSDVESHLKTKHISAKLEQTSRGKINDIKSA